MSALLTAPLLLSALLVHAQQNKIDDKQAIALEGKAARLFVSLKGGVIKEFRLQREGRNPLHSLGHFLCLDRWGQPSAAEAKNGMPFHGEASQVEWQVLRPPEKHEGAIEAEMAAALPLAGLEIKRRVRLSETAAFFVVREEVTNKNRLGRIYNLVQHPTIGPPFLNETTLVDANAGKGFMQGSPLPNPERPAVNWPQALDGGHAIDMRRLTGKDTPNVVSYVIDGKYGWTTACNPAQGLLIGYLWKASDYLWFDAWLNVADGKPAARGLEFGTTGLHQPFPILVAKGRIFGRSLYEYLDADQAVSRSYAGFLFPIPADYRGVAQVTYAGGQLTLRERGAGGGGELKMRVGELFPE